MKPTSCDKIAPMTLTEFLLARIAEDERVAREAEESGGGEWWSPIEIWSHFRGEGNRDLLEAISGANVATARDVPVHTPSVDDLPDAEHIARFSPLRILAECEAKRAIVARVQSYEWDDDQRLQGAIDEAEYACRILAAVYADHSDYDQSWRP